MTKSIFSVFLSKRSYFSVLCILQEIIIQTCLTRLRGPPWWVSSPWAFPPWASTQGGGSGASPGGRLITPHVSAIWQPGAAGESREENAEEKEEEQAEETAAPAFQRPVGSHWGEVRPQRERWKEQGGGEDTQSFYVGTWGLVFLYISHQWLVWLSHREKEGWGGNVEKVRQKARGEDKRRKEWREKKDREDVRREGELEMCNAVFLLVYRIKLTLPGVAPQA